MGAEIRYTGDMEFTDDEPVECDCGCIVEAGNEFSEYSIDVFDRRANEVVNITFTYCGCEECLGRLLAENLEGYAREVEHHIDTAEDSAGEYADYKYEEDITDRLLRGDFD